MPPSGATMTLPVTGPFYKDVYIPTRPHWSGISPIWYEKHQASYRQAKPYDRPLPYSVGVIKIRDQENYNVGYVHVGNAPGYLHTSTTSQRLYNKAYESFIGDVNKAKADILTLMRERQKALSMISDRAIQLVLFMRAAVKRDLSMMRTVVRQAGYQVGRNGVNVGFRHKARKAGGHVLEYSFGWAPLASDLSNAVKVFQNGPPSGLCKGRARQDLKRFYRIGEIPTQTISITEHIGWTLRSRIRVVNSDIVLLNSLGLINFASSLWETTPWSFVFDYFVNVQTFLNGFTDRLGLDFEHASSTFLAFNEARVLWVGPGNDPSRDGNFSSARMNMTRSLGISRPTLAWRSPWSLSPQRALTSIALLLQKIKG